MILLWGLFFLLAFVQGWIMRQLGMTRRWGRSEIRLEWAFSAWGIFWVITVLEITQRLNYFNLATLFLVSLPGIAWGFIPRKHSSAREILDIILALYRVIDRLSQKIVFQTGK